MKKLTILAAALIGSCAAASATTVAPTFVGNLGNDPIASVTNDIIKRDVTNTFTDAYLFTLTPPGTFAVTGSATENYSTADRLINPFTVSFWSVGTDGLAGTADDFQLIGQTGGAAPGAVPGSAQASSSGFIDSP